MRPRLPCERGGARREEPGDEDDHHPGRLKRAEAGAERDDGGGRRAQASDQSVWPHGSLERPPPQDGDPRLARIRRRIVLRGLVRHRCEAGDRHVGSGRVRPGTHDPGRRLQAARVGVGAGPERNAEDNCAGVRRRDTRCPGCARTSTRGHEHPLPARADERRPDLGRRTVGPRRLPDPRRLRPRRRQDRSDPRSDRPGAGGTSPGLHRHLWRCQRRSGARGGLHGRPEEGGPLLGPDHADHPDRRLRGARRCGDPAAARVDGRPGDVRVVGDPEPHLAERRVALRDDSPDRARRRGRLLDVLLEAGTRGARCRAEPRAGARDSRRDIRTLGARLRRDGDHRHGGLALRRGRIRALRRGHDARGRSRHDRLTDGAAGRPVQAGRQRRAVARAVRPPSTSQ